MRRSPAARRRRRTGTIRRTTRCRRFGIEYLGLLDHAERRRLDRRRLGAATIFFAGGANFPTSSPSPRSGAHRRHRDTSGSLTFNPIAGTAAEHHLQQRHYRRQAASTRPGRTRSFSADDTATPAARTSTAARSSIGADANLGAVAALTFDGGTLKATKTFDAERGSRHHARRGGRNVPGRSDFTLTYNGDAAATGGLTRTGTGILELGGHEHLRRHHHDRCRHAQSLRVARRSPIPLPARSSLERSGATLELINNETIGSLSGGGATGGPSSSTPTRSRPAATTPTPLSRGIIAGTGISRKKASARSR